MNKTARYFLLFLSGWVILSSCEDFLGDEPVDDYRDAIIDSWKCSESDTYLKSTMAVYWVHIYEHPDDTNKVLIYNFFDLDEEVAAEAVVSGRNINLPDQTLEGGFTFHGSARISGGADRIDWTYYLDDGSGVEEEITAVYTRN